MSKLLKDCSSLGHRCRSLSMTSVVPSSCLPMTKLEVKRFVAGALIGKQLRGTKLIGERLPISEVEPEVIAGGRATL